MPPQIRSISKRILKTADVWVGEARHAHGGLGACSSHPYVRTAIFVVPLAGNLPPMNAHVHRMTVNARGHVVAVGETGRCARQGRGCGRVRRRARPTLCIDINVGPTGGV